MNRADSIVPRYYGGDPLAHAPAVAAPARKRPPLVEYPGRLGEADELGELRYVPIHRQGKKRRLSRGLLAYFICSAAIVLGLTAFYLVREEKVASANAACTQLERENSALLVSYEAKRTQFECSTDIAAVRDIAGKKMNMGYATEDQIRFVSYSDAAALQQSVLLSAAAPASLTEAGLQSQGETALDMILPESSPGEESQSAQRFMEEGGLVIPVETPVEDETPGEQAAEIDGTNTSGEMDAGADIPQG